MILAIKTDNPTATVIVLNDEGEVLIREEWLAERRLAHELLGKLEAVLARAGGGFVQLSGLIVFRGPGSFTGLRIGSTVMNTIAYAQTLPIVGQEGESWVSQGVERLSRGESDEIVLPAYGAPARITMPKK